MADPTNRNLENITGRFYVDDTCIDCDLCRSNASTIFKRQDDAAYSYVYRQPVTEEEIAVAREAMLDCPSESIGEDSCVAPLVHRA